MGELMAVCQDRRALANWRAGVRHDGAQGTARPTAFGRGRTRRSVRNFSTRQLLKHQRAEIGWLAHDSDLGGLMAVCQDRRALANWRAWVRHDGAQGTARLTAFGQGRTRRSVRNFSTRQLLKHQRAEIGWLAHDPDMGGLMAVCQDRRALDKRRARVRHDGAQGTARPTVFGQGRTLRSVRNYLSLVTSSPTGF